MRPVAEQRLQRLLEGSGDPVGGLGGDGIEIIFDSTQLSLTDTDFV